MVTVSLRQLTIHVLLEISPMTRTLNCLSMYELKEEDINYFISRNIAMKSQKYVSRSRNCDLCKYEKLLILRADQNVLLNENDEFV